MKLRQLPQLYLRGAIANETMRFMSPGDRNNVERLTVVISNMPVMGGHKHRFMEKLGQTIGGDYHKNRQAAEQEFNIAIWRALVYLLYHTNYSYRCEACNATEYITSKSKPKAFDRRYPICPTCNKVKITEQGSSKLVAGQFVDVDEVQNQILEGEAPQYISPIVSIKGVKKVVDHEAVLNDPSQIKKYFGEFVWNYFRQTLRENERKFHQLEGTWVNEGGDSKLIEGRMVTGPADQVAVEEAISMLVKQKVPYTYEPKANPIDGAYRIQAELLITNQLISRQLRILIDKYAKFGVTISASDTEVSVNVTEAAPTVDANIVIPQLICLQGRASDDDSEASVYDAYQHRIHSGSGGVPMQEDGIAQVESEDLLHTIRDNLCDGAQQVYDIMLGQGDTYHKFVDFQRGPDNTKSDAYCERPRNTHIARFLGTTPRQVLTWLRDIKVQCLAHNVGSEA